MLNRFIKLSLRFWSLYRYLNQLYSGRYEDPFIKIDKNSNQICFYSAVLPIVELSGKAFVGFRTRFLGKDFSALFGQFGGQRLSMTL